MKTKAFTLTRDDTENKKATPAYFILTGLRGFLFLREMAGRSGCEYRLLDTEK